MCVGFLVQKEIVKDNNLRKMFKVTLNSEKNETNKRDPTPQQTHRKN